MHDTVVRARFPIDNVKKIVRVSDNFWKMSSANSARDHVAGVNKMRAGLF